MQEHTGTFRGTWGIQGIQGNPRESREIQGNTLEYGGIQRIIWEYMIRKDVFRRRNG